MRNFFFSSTLHPVCGELPILLLGMGLCCMWGAPAIAAAPAETRGQFQQLQNRPAQDKIWDTNDASLFNGTDQNGDIVMQVRPQMQPRYPSAQQNQHTLIVPQIYPSWPMSPSQPQQPPFVYRPNDTPYPPSGFYPPMPPPPGIPPQPPLPPQPGNPGTPGVPPAPPVTPPSPPAWSPPSGSTPSAPPFVYRPNTGGGLPLPPQPR